MRGRLSFSLRWPVPARERVAMQRTEDRLKQGIGFAWDLPFQPPSYLPIIRMSRRDGNFDGHRRLNNDHSRFDRSACSCGGRGKQPGIGGQIDALAGMQHATGVKTET